MLFKLTRRIEPVKQDLTLEVTHDDVSRTDTLPVTEITPDKKKKYLVSVEVGDLAPSDAMHYLKRSRDSLKEFFGEEVMVVPSRQGHPSIAVYEVEAVS